MKIIQVNCVYKTGSTGNIVYDIHKYLCDTGCDSLVAYGRGENTKDQGVYRVCGNLYAKMNNLFSRVSGLMYGGCFLSTRRLIKFIENEVPDVVHIHCINGYFVNIYKLISWLKTSKIKTVITLHAEFMHTANCSHALDCDRWKTGCGNCSNYRQITKSWFFDRTHKSWQLMRDAFDCFDNLAVVSVSPWLRGRAEESPILKNANHAVILNGLDTDVFKPCDTAHLRDKYSLEGKKVVFHATPSFKDDPQHIKGGFYVLRIAEKMLHKYPDVRFVVAGEYEQGIKIPENVILLGKVANRTLMAELYSLADVTLLTSQKETFSMVVAESLCCGTPVVGFKAGAPEQIAIEKYSSFVEYADTEGLYDKLVNNLEKEKNAYVTELRNLAQERYSKGAMVRKYAEIYDMKKEVQ